MPNGPWNLRTDRWPDAGLRMRDESQRRKTRWSARAAASEETMLFGHGPLITGVPKLSPTASVARTRGGCLVLSPERYSDVNQLWRGTC